MNAAVVEPVEVEATAVHEAAHAVLAELFGWRVRGLHLRGSGDYLEGLTTFQTQPPHPLADISVSCIGHTAEMYFGGHRRGASRGDWADARKALRRCGVRVNPAQVRGIEDRLAGLFMALPALAGMTRRVAEALLGSDTGCLTRGELLEAAGRRVRSRRLRQRVRKLCQRIALEVAGLDSTRGKNGTPDESDTPDDTDGTSVSRAAATAVLAALLGLDVEGIEVRPDGSVNCEIGGHGEPWVGAAVGQAGESFAEGRSPTNRLGVVFNDPRIQLAVRRVADAINRVGFLGPASLRSAAGDVVADPEARARAEVIARVAVCGFPTRKGCR